MVEPSSCKQRETELEVKKLYMWAEVHVANSLRLQTRL